MQRMRESKLQKKTIKLVLQIYLSVLLICLVLSYFLVISPLMKSAIEGYKSQNDYILEEADSLLNSIKEYTNYIAYSENLIPHINAYLKNPEDKVVRFNLETYLYNAKNLKMGDSGCGAGCGGPGYGELHPRFKRRRTKCSRI